MEIMEKISSADETSQKFENFGIDLKSISKVDHVHSFAKLLTYFALIEVICYHLLEGETDE